VSQVSSKADMVGYCEAIEETEKLLSNKYCYKVVY